MDKYKVVSSGQQNQALKHLFHQAETEGRLSEAMTALKNLMSLLESTSESVGEMLFHLKHWRLPVRHVVQPPWSLYFAVDQERRIVYVRSFALLAQKE